MEEPPVDLRLLRAKAGRSGGLPLHPQHPQLLPELGPRLSQWLLPRSSCSHGTSCRMLSRRIFFQESCWICFRHCEESSCDGAGCIPLLLRSCLQLQEVGRELCSLKRWLFSQLYFISRDTLPTNLIFQFLLLIFLVGFLLFVGGWDLDSNCSRTNKIIEKKKLNGKQMVSLKLFIL